jgi:hypothetical protein
MRFNYHGYSGLTSISSDPGYHPLRSLGSNSAALAKNSKTATEPIHFQNVAEKEMGPFNGAKLVLISATWFRLRRDSESQGVSAQFHFEKSSQF